MREREKVYHSSSSHRSVLFVFLFIVIARDAMSTCAAVAPHEGCTGAGSPDEFTNKSASISMRVLIATATLSMLFFCSRMYLLRHCLRLCRVNSISNSEKSTPT